MNSPKSATASGKKAVPFGTMIEEIAHKQLSASETNQPSPPTRSRQKTATADEAESPPAPAANQGLDGSQAVRTYQAELEKLQIEEFQQKLKLRSVWSRFLMGMVVLMILFQMGLFVSVGLGWLQFGDEWIARLVLPGTFAQILGFVYIIITYLFPTTPPATSDQGEDNS